MQLSNAVLDVEDANMTYVCAAGVSARLTGFGGSDGVNSSFHTLCSPAQDRASHLYVYVYVHVYMCVYLVCTYVRVCT